MNDACRRACAQSERSRLVGRVLFGHHRSHALGSVEGTPAVHANVPRRYATRAVVDLEVEEAHGTRVTADGRWIRRRLRRSAPSAPAAHARAPRAARLRLRFLHLSPQHRVELGIGRVVERRHLERRCAAVERGTQPAIPRRPPRRPPPPPPPPPPSVLAPPCGCALRRVVGRRKAPRTSDERDDEGGDERGADGDNDEVEVSYVLLSNPDGEGAAQRRSSSDRAEIRRPRQKAR